MEAIAYLRRSSAPNADSRSVSFEMQEAAVRDLAARRGDTITAVLSDWARSGGSTKRPGYQELLRLVDSGRVKVIYGYSLSRLSRSILDFADLMERCQGHGVAVRLVRDGDMDWSTASGRAFAQMAAVFAQFERELAAERAQSAYAERRARGDVLGQAPYGSRIEAGQLVDHPDEDLDAVLAAFREAGSFGGAARLLNERSIQTRRSGTAWGHTAVARILRRVAPADCALPLRMARAKASPIGSQAFSGLLACPCGSTLTGRRGKNKDGSPYVEYFCNRAYRVPGHGKVVVREHLIRAWFEQEAALLRRARGVEAESSRAEPMIARLEARRERVLDMYEAGDIDAGERQRRLARVESELTPLLESQAMTRDIIRVPSLSWDWPPQDINAHLRALWKVVMMDEKLRPIEAIWRVPEWRAAA